MSARPSALNPGVARREVWAWAMYDFANSGYTTVVLTAVFNAYFVSVVAANADWATFAWTAALSVSYLGVIVLGPILGAWSDAHAAKKPLLAISTVICIAGTVALALAGPGTIGWAVGAIIVSNIAYSMGENLCAAFLPELARPEALGKVSGWGWSLGYFGGILALAISLAWVMSAPSRGATSAQAVPGTMIITAAVYGLAALPTFLFLRERAVPAEVPGARVAFARLMQTAHAARTYKDLLLVFACGTLYQAGVATVIALAAIYAEQVMGFETHETIILILVVNVTAAVGAFGFGYAQDRIGKVAALRVTIVGWIAMTVVAFFSTTAGMFWVAANLAGLCMGSSQSAGRALVAYLSPVDRASEFFGLWGVAIRLAAILGPLTYGAVTWLTHGNHRLAILLTGAFFLASLAVLAFVDEARGRSRVA
ncbi:MAG TPA: MFS transporter [Usitatibacter sp.]|jgi:UMF1 family MFS transporter|nr:MFS transporter [Usitatibacter sp.]